MTTLFNSTQLLAPLYDLTPQQTNDGDWTYTFQLIDVDTGLPQWPGTPPADLVVTMKLVKGTPGADYGGETKLTAKSNDGSGMVTLLTDSFIDFAIPYGTMQSLSEGRYRVHLQFDQTGSRITQTIGYLPLIRGPK